MHTLLWMNVMLNFMFMNFAELWTTVSKRKIQNENIWLHRESNQGPSLSSVAPLTIRLRWQFSKQLWKLWHHFGIPITFFYFSWILRYQGCRFKKNVHLVLPEAECCKTRHTVCSKSIWRQLQRQLSRLQDGWVQVSSLQDGWVQVSSLQDGWVQVTSLQDG